TDSSVLLALFCVASIVILCFLFIFLTLLRPPPIATLFPYTTLFRSRWPEGPVLGWRARRPRRSVRARDRGGPGRLGATWCAPGRSEEHTSELQSRFDLVCRLLLEKKTIKKQCEALT